MSETGGGSRASRQARRTRAAYRAVAPAVTPVMRVFERGLTAGAGRHFRRAVRALPAGRVLDLGTGTGRQLRALPPARLQDAVGLDPVESLLRRMARRLPAAHAVVGDAHCPPFRPGSFDAAIGGWVWETLADRTMAAKELSRAVRPGGMVLLVACTRPSGPARLVARVFDVALVGLLGATVDQAELTSIDGFVLMECRQFAGGLFTFVRLRRCSRPGVTPPIAVTQAQPRAGGASPR